MESSVAKYLRMEVHPDIQNKIWSPTIVEGIHERSPSKACISSIEKMDKPFNCQRPTTSVDYVKHYAAITASYLFWKGGSPDSVHYTLPSKSESLRPLLDSNLE